MADAQVQLQPDGTGKKVDVAELSGGALGSVERQRISIADDTSYNAHAGVVNADPAGNSYGLVTRPLLKNFVLTQNLNPTPTQVASSGTYNSPVINLGSLTAGGPAFSRWRVFLVADQPGTLALQQSVDNSAFYTTLTVPVTANTAVIGESLIALQYLRAAYTNSGSATTTLLLIWSALVAV